MRLKQTILVRADLKLPKGKLGAQTAHASVEATLRSDKDVVKEWRGEGMAKIVLIADTHYGVRNDNVNYYNYFEKFFDKVFLSIIRL